MKTRIYRSAVLFCLVGLSAVLSHAQPVTGTSANLPFGSFQSGPIDTVNLGNLNVNIDIPVMSKPGRGTPFQYSLVYNSSIWYPVTSGSTKSWKLVSSTSVPGWQGLTAAGNSSIGFATSTSSNRCTNNGTTWYYFTTSQFGNYYYYDQYGASHWFSGLGYTYISNPYSSICGPQSGYQGQNGGNTQSQIASDGTGFTMYLTPSPSGTNAWIVDRNGNTLTPPVTGTTPPPTKVLSTDPNGNQIKVSSGAYSDTLGTTALTIAGVVPSNTTLTYTSPTGSLKSYTVRYAAYVVETKFGCSGISEFGPTTKYLVSQIDLPDDTHYYFQYETTPNDNNSPHHVTGRLSSVTLPTGGSVTYAYSGGNNGIQCSDGSIAGLTRTVNPGGTWTYSRSLVGTHWQTTVTTPPDSQNPGSVGNDTVIDFQSSMFYETQRKSYQGSSTGGTLLRTVQTCYNGGTTDCTEAAITGNISQLASTLQYPGGLQSRSVTYYNGSGLVTQQTQSPFGDPTATLRNTQITYASLGNGIQSRPSVVTVKDGSNNLLSKTTYGYDETSVLSSGISMNHISVSGSRGNATTVTRYSTGTNGLSQHFIYYDTGTVYQFQDVNNGANNNAATTYTYGTGSCNGAFPTRVDLPVASMFTTTTWNCTGGVATSATDVNGKSTSATYADPNFWRPTAIQDALSNTTSLNYTTTTVTSSLPFNGSNSVSESLTTLDNLGRAYLSQTRQGPSSSSYDSVLTTFDNMGRPSTTTMPFVGAASVTSSTAAVNTTTYDALSRVTQVKDGGNGYVSYSYVQNDVLQTRGPAPTGENSKQKQLEYDALGRLTSVCEITNATGSGAAPCGQNNAATGLLTRYVYDVLSGQIRYTVTQNAQSASTQTRTYYYDLLGRLVKETNPENGDTLYTYDSASGCAGPYNGDLVRRQDQKGNVACMSYDGLHRLTGVTYSGGDSGSTPTKTFVYDSATVAGVAMTNAKGHLAEAYTGPLASKITDLGFSYSDRGEVSSVYQKRPRSTNYYYQVSAGYWENGALKTLSSNISGLPTQTYGVDGEGRPYSVSAGSGQNPVTSTTYDLANYKTTVSFGSLDSDEFTSDANTGRMTGYKNNVGNQSVVGTLTWNTDGSLRTLAISDPLNTANSQTCNYGSDDLGRIATVDCGASKWKQNFSYDAVGNIKKDVPTDANGTKFLPTYDFATNKFGTLPDVAAPYYDQNGRLTNDGSHTYGWDSDGNLTTVDSSQLTYDALGRLVEQNRGGSYTQVVYGPGGSKFATMNDLTLVSAFVPLPGGASAVYSGQSAGGPQGYVYCATENGYCAFTGTTQVAYGANGTFVYQSLTNGTPCNNATFGDPPYGTLKACYVQGPALAYYRHPDWLGSSRSATTPSRTLYSSRAFAPYGESYAESGPVDISFTGQDQLTAHDLYDFLYRRYSPVQGRWLSPDPAALAAVDPTSPQTWNRYGYVANSPLTFVDPLGLQKCHVIDGTLVCYPDEPAPPTPSPNPVSNWGPITVHKPTPIIDIFQTDDAKKCQDAEGKYIPCRKPGPKACQDVVGNRIPCALEQKCADAAMSKFKQAVGKAGRGYTRDIKLAYVAGGGAAGTLAWLHGMNTGQIITEAGKALFVPEIVGVATAWGLASMTPSQSETFDEIAKQLGEDLSKCSLDMVPASGH